MFEFQNPLAFLFLLFIPLLYILRYFKIFAQISYPAVLEDWQGKKFEWKGKIRKILSIFSKVLLIFAFILCVIAFADPVISSQEKVYTSLGTDIIFVVDTSPSMAAKDVDGQNRMAVAKSSINTLIKEHDGYRYGIVALGSDTSVFVPPTNDLNIISKKLAEINVGILGNGSAIGDGLSTAVCHLASSSAPKKCIILLTDGENNAGEIHPETAAKLCAEKQIPVYIVGIGSKGTVPIEYTDPFTGKLYSGYLDSNFNAASLKKISTISNGRYFEAKSVSELSSALNYVTKTENVVQNFTYKTVKNRFYKQLLLIVVLIIIITWFIKRILLKEHINFHFRKIIIVRTGLLAFSFIMLILAYSGLSWGTFLAPVQKSGTAVSFVMDISNSMLANDGPDQMTRLEASSVYAKKLLEKMDDISVSVVLAKGDGVAAIPLTEDKMMINSLLDVLSPALMTTPGTGLGNGILCAKTTFPENFSSAGRIWVFTDGEETDGQLENALTECIKSGIPVTIIGFGKEKEVNVLAGDRKTYVKSALRTNRIYESIENADKKLQFIKIHTPITYINSLERGSAVKLLTQLQSSSTDNQIVAYEARPIPRFKLFLFFSILAFAFSYIFSEFDFRLFFKNKAKKNKSMLFGATCVFSIFLSSCTATSETLKGAYAFQQKQYRHSIACFLKAKEYTPEQKLEFYNDYSMYNLGTAYSMLGENEAAIEKFSQVSSEAPKNVRYSTYYNAGILAHKNAQYEEAQKFFRKALEVDNSKIEAKINLELSIQMLEAAVKQNEAQLLPAVEEKNNMPEIEKGVFEHIKENDQKQWKNSESPQNINLAEDY